MIDRYLYILIELNNNTFIFSAIKDMLMSINKNIWITVNEKYYIILTYQSFLDVIIFFMYNVYFFLYNVLKCY